MVRLEDNRLKLIKGNDVKLSVVIPLHNVEEYLNRCVESVIAQNYEYMEIIFVDDGSTDQTAEVCNKYCQSDNRFRYIYQEDSWLSASRNNGMRNAIGEYIIFLDPDDYWEADLCETVIPIMDEYNLDMLQFDFYYEFSDTDKEIITFCSETHIENWSEDNLVKNMCTKWLKPRYPNTVWGKVFNRNFLSGTKIQFMEDLRGHEDSCFFGMVFPYITKVGYVHKPLYHYIQHSKSLMHNSSVKIDFYKDAIKSYDYIVNSWSDEIRRQTEMIKPIIFCRRLQTAFLIMKNTYSNEKICETLEVNYRQKIDVELDYNKVNYAVSLYAEMCELNWRSKMMMMLFAYSLIDGKAAMIEWQKMYLCF